MVDGPQTRDPIPTSRPATWTPVPDPPLDLPPLNRPLHQGFAARVTAGESDIATRLLAVIGAVVFVAGVVFFLKLAFDRGWIAPAARIALGVVGGLGLWGLGTYLDAGRRMPVYGQTLAALGAVTAYVATWLAYQLPSFRAITGLSIEADAILLGVLALGLATHAVLRRTQWLAGVALALVLATVFIASSWAGFTVGYLVTMVALLVAAAGVRRWTALQTGAAPVAFATLAIHLGLGVSPAAVLAGVAVLVLAFTVAGALRPRGRGTDQAIALQVATQTVTWLGGWGLALACLAGLHVAGPWPGIVTGTAALAAYILASARPLPAGSRLGWGACGVVLGLVWPVLQFDGAWVALAWAAMALAVGLASMVAGSRVLTGSAAALAAFTFGRLAVVDAVRVAEGTLAWAPALLLFGLVGAAGAVGWFGSALARRSDPASWTLLAVACAAPMLYAGVALHGPPITLAWAGMFLVVLIAGIAGSRPDLRIAGLSLLGPVLVRLVGFDLSGVDVVLRVLAYMGVGAALLVGAFFYARATATRRRPGPARVATRRA